MTFRPAFAALLALFAVACQPAQETQKPDASDTPDQAQANPPVATAGLARFQTGQFKQLDFSSDLAIPTASFVDAAGKTHSFANYKGKVVVYNIWAEWCGPCVEEMPTLANLQKAFAGEDVVVVPVAYGAGSKLDSSVAKLKSIVGEDLPFFFDAELNVNAEARSGALPSTIIYDKSGMEQVRLVYPAKWDAPEAIALVQAVLDGET